MSLAQFVARHSTVKRHVVVPTYRYAARLRRFSPPPRVFANSVPKAGTHLLAALLSKLPRMSFSGIHRSIEDFEKHANGNTRPFDLDIARIEKCLRSVNQGQFVTAHMPYEPEVERLLQVYEYRHIFILRDPRDIVVSHADYVTGMKSHPLHRLYGSEMSTRDERIMASICGMPPTAESPGLESIGDRLALYAPWVAAEGVLIVRFVDLVGSRGRGDDVRQAETIRRIADFVGRPLSDADVAEVALRTWSPGSSTFKMGQVGRWQGVFTPAHKERFKEIANDYLIALGYESGSGW